MERPGIQRSPWAPVRGHAATASQRPSCGGLHFAFEPGPYYLGASGRTLHHDNMPGPGGLVTVVSSLANAHLLKAAPDLFTVAQALAALPALRTTSDVEALAARIEVLAQPARVPLARALGVMA